MTSEEAIDRIQIRDLIVNWAIWRDSGNWDRFATLWHPDGRMVATWFQASAADFIARSRAALEGGGQVLHSLGGSSIDLNGTRAIVQTQMHIRQRGPVHGVPVDVICQGRFLDALEKRDGRWGMVLRHPIYELDSMIPVDPAASLTLDPDLLQSFPEGYRHLAYLQTQLGFDVHRALPGTRGPEITQLMARANLWLTGDSADI